MSGYTNCESVVTSDQVDFLSAIFSRRIMWKTEGFTS